MLKEGVRLDRVRGGRQKYRRSTDPYTPVKSSATLEGNFFLIRFYVAVFRVDSTMANKRDNYRIIIEKLVRFSTLFEGESAIFYNVR